MARATTKKAPAQTRFTRDTEAGTVDLPLKMPFVTMERLIEFENFDSEGKSVREQVGMIRQIIDALPVDARPVMEQLDPAEITSVLQDWFYAVKGATPGESQGSAA